MSLLHIAAGLGLLLAVLGFAVWQAAMARRWAWLCAVRLVSLITVSSAALWVFLSLARDPLASRLAPLFGASTQFFGIFLALRLLDTVFFDSAFSRRRGVSVPRLLRDIVRWIAAFFVLMIILRANLGIDLTPLVATSAALTFVLGFALQDVLGNLFAGIAINVEQPFTIGDRISIDGRDGTVETVNWRATRILTYDNEYLMVPNSIMAKGVLLNYSQPPIPKARSFFINIGYEVRPNRVKSVIREAMLSVPGVVSEPPPRVWLMDFGEHAISYRVKFWVRRFEDGYDTNDRVKSQIWYHLNRSGIIVPYPRRTVQMLAQEEVSARQSHHVARARQLLRRVPLFTELDEEPLATLAAEASAVFYAAGESLVRQGESGDSLYVIQQGCVEVIVASAGGQAATVARLGRGDFFGEMSLLTGEARGATVRALEDTSVLVIRKEHLSPLLEGNPDIAEFLSRAMELRQKENLEKLARFEDDDEPDHQEASFGLILKRVKGFFGLS